MVSVCICLAGKLPVCSLRHRVSSRQLFKACGGIPGSSSRHSLSPAYFMGTGGRASQMVFLRNYYVLIHCEGACSTLPLLPSYWEVTVRLTVQRECMKNREEGGWWVMWKVLVFKVLCSECQTLRCILSLGLGGRGSVSRTQTGELRSNVCSFSVEELVADSTRKHLSLERGLLKCVYRLSMQELSPGRPLRGGLFLKYPGSGKQVRGNGKFSDRKKSNNYVFIIYSNY